MADPFTNAQGEAYARDILWNGYDANLKPEVVDVLNRTQQLVDFPISLSSGYRSPSRNAAAGGAKKSQHLTGNAVDISVKGLTDEQRTQLTRALAQSGALRLGAYSGNTGLHLDMAKGYKPQGDYPVFAMFDRSARNMASAQPWFKAGLDGGKIPPGSVPQVATLTDTAPPAVTPASLPPQLAFTRQMTLPSYNVTPVLDRRSNKNIDNRKEVSVNSGINIPIQNAGMPPLPQMRPPAPGYKMAGKVQLAEDRFASGMADKTPPGATRVASLAPMVPMPRPRPEQTVTMPKTVAPDLINDTFATLGFERNSGGTKVADLYKGVLPVTPLTPAQRQDAPGQSFAGQDRFLPPRPVLPAQPAMPPAPIPMPRSMRPADPGLNGNPNMHFGTRGMTPNIPAQIPPVIRPISPLPQRASVPMPRPRPAFSFLGLGAPQITVSGARPMPVAPTPAVRQLPSERTSTWSPYGGADNLTKPTSQLRPGDRSYNSDTNSWERKAPAPTRR